MSVYYLWDEERKLRLNQAGVDDTSSYLPVLLRQLGVTGQPLAPDQIHRLKETDVLLASRTPLPELPCTVISFAPAQDGLEIPEKKLYGTFRCVSPDAPRLPIFVPVSPEQSEAEVLGLVTTEDGTTLPGWLRRGNCHEFTFDLPASVWYSGDGFGKKGGINGFDKARTPDTRPLPVPYDTSVPYSDVLCDCLRDILSGAGVPVLDCLPLMPDGGAADFALFFAGDDDATSAEVNRTAVYYMEEIGLPYHINAMPADRESFIMDRELFRKLRDHGCEFALHTDFLPVDYTEEEQKKQADLYRQVFGEATVTNVNHCLIQDGTAAERLSWLEAQGILADNGKMGEIDPEDVNAFNMCGYAFGTSFPRYTLSDAASGNRIIETMEIPCAYYEPRFGGEKYPNEEPIRRYLDESARFGRISEFFMHPHYFTEEFGNQEAVHGALKLIQEHCAQKEYKVCMTTVDRIARFWADRSKSCIRDLGHGTYEIQAKCPLAVQLPEGKKQVDCKESPILVTEVSRAGKPVYLALIPQAGTYTLTLVA